MTTYSETPSYPGQPATRWRVEARTTENPPRTFQLGDEDVFTRPTSDILRAVPVDYFPVTVHVVPLYDQLEWSGADDAEPVDMPAEPSAEPDSIPTFGNRLREFNQSLDRAEYASGEWLLDELPAIADSIDSDRDELGDELGSALAALETEQRRFRLARERVEAAVEELRYPVVTVGDREIEVVEVEPLWNRLAGIFADLAQTKPTYYKADPAAARFEIPGRDDTLGLHVAVNPDGTTFFWPVDKLVGQGFALSGAAARDLVRLLGAALPAEPEFALAAPMDTRLPDTDVEGQDR